MKEFEGREIRDLKAVLEKEKYYEESCSSGI
jgi:hypothetical protein